MSLEGREIVVLGRLAEAYGIRGWLRMHPFGDDPLAWRQIPVWFVGKEGGPWRQVAFEGLKAHGDGWILALDGVTDRSAAEELKGFLIGAPRDALPETGVDEFYWADLIGLPVINEAGEVLGTVDGLIETGANDVLRVLAGDGVERLIPFVSAVVLAVDKGSGEGSATQGCIRVAWGSDW